MKRFIVLIITVVFVAALSSSAYAVIAGSAHDFSTNTAAPTVNTGGRICVACHTPHNGDPYNTGTDGAPLWNRQITAFSSFSMYVSVTGTFQATQASQPQGVSKLCLSCHDGTIALDNFGGVTTGSNTMTGAALVGTDLSDDHPISFTYNDALANSDGELELPGTDGRVGSTGDNNLGLPLYGTSQDQVECASCHDVHNTPGYPYLLRDTLAASALCDNCHNK